MEDVNTLGIAVAQQWTEALTAEEKKREAARLAKTWGDMSAIGPFHTHTKTLYPPPPRPPAGAWTTVYETTSPAVVPCAVLPLNNVRMVMYITQHIAGGNATIIATAVGDNDTVLAGCCFCPASEVLGRELLEVEKIRALAMRTAELWQQQYGEYKK